VEQRWNDSDKENRKPPRKACSIATWSTTSPTKTDLDSNLDLRGQKPATNGLTRVTAIHHCTVTK